MNINYTVGDATDPPRDSPAMIVHICNDAGAWGAGFVLAVSRRWAEPEKAYRAWFWNEPGKGDKLGKTQIVPVGNGLWVANLIGQDGIYRQGGKPPIRYEAVRQGLEKISWYCQYLPASVHMPRIGCGLAGGKWEEIEPIIQEELVDKGIPVTVYDLP